MLADMQAKIVDTVSYQNLIPGKTYTMEGVLYDRETRSPLLVDGEKVATVATFEAEGTHGSVEMEFSLVLICVLYTEFLSRILLCHIKEKTEKLLSRKM